ncbi:hypothetical protein A3C20_00125 [Candidatus Kaiserbacteria bacterium RIFCSPHIGHO2_02_FULL_55_25]|uniref:Uncharacterized protein n=1 Tax=Candidatus Kaiserbacteria bacterium RIFCSPHIGHO2_02_FULL_55_25 TaxID=1798498 RepID=A0A1F6E7T7_9BACT|nr:MAG: hypothetical protein A2764_01695 [Candidatus Kaiserbacteria bacterium RIFCSPHIGHO2_01_FULL_55_79]OGG69759.1 MAG: hypothetical protein A3C20_00125 [Candidatus Kaiserbacteria bacterium RIFCSPHIGHO2_02_FULL_55_25]OGG77568.1 MAG: hypothetical protein A3F56_02045 [Candidatus Kaiserbacteria bacterium RIFCSPHIGHO2_12_FULL_55_13]OGG83202.1 MAG: hypothetical protein A3A42_01400 [Candidatus Kaiserbacteria bacterium RIFCSPLOWO2_01_FULL_55_25]
MNERVYMLGAALLVAVQAFVLFLFGQPAICTCGYVKLWEGVILGAGNSQHLMDWYTFSHIIHGIIFYALLTYFFPKMSVWARLLIATGIEAAWEILENTPWLVEHYREQALAQGYTGDSIINSVSDTLVMMLGFLIARKWAVWAVIALALFLELWVAYEIRDNLTLNVTNLLHQFDFISAWQSGV